MEVTSIAALEALYGTPKPPSVVKVATQITPEYRAYIQAARFVALATVGPEGADCSPRGDHGPVVFEEDPHTLALPDRRGNDRIDTLRNIVCVNGRGRILADPDLPTPGDILAALGAGAQNGACGDTRNGGRKPRQRRVT